MRKSLKYTLLSASIAGALLFTANSCRFYAGGAGEKQEGVEKRVDSIISQMTLKEKIDMLGGTNRFYINTPKRLSVPNLKMSDGPVGVREEPATSTAYPATIALAASWNRDLAKRFGTAHAKDCRARGVHMILAPGVDIYRAPMCGRNFEYYGEDPYLAGEMATAQIKAIKKEGVMACVKHYCCNNQEWNRYNVSSDVDERTLREIYLPAFKAAIQKGGASSVMGAYNLVNGRWACENKHILTDILKNEWDFKGFVVSDWGATHSSVKALNAGLDLEMPKGRHLNYENLKPAIDKGEVTIERIDDAVKRMLRGMVEMGFLDREQKDKSIADMPEEAKKTALQMAREGVVLLKNKGEILPLDMQKIHTIAVIGPNADPAVTGGGGSSHVEAQNPVSLLGAIKERFGKNIKILYTQGFNKNIPELQIESLKGEYFNNGNFAGKPVATRNDKKIKFRWKTNAPMKGMKKDNFSVRWTGTVTPDKSGVFKFTVSSDDTATVYLDGVPVMKSLLDEKVKKINLKAGRKYKIKVDYTEGAMGAGINFSVKRIPADFSEAMKIAKAADAVILSVGFNKETEHEGRDRTFALPDPQDQLIEAVTKVNPNTIIVLNAGGNVDMQQWISKIKGLLMAWYPGQEGGTAIAEILAGDVNPSGKLPATFEKRWKENPCYNSYYENTDKKSHVEYKEGIFIGYRGYDKNKTTPQFPFGFGLSYTTFKYGNLEVSQENSTVKVSFDLTNSGKSEGAEVVQVYIHDTESSVPRPPKELKGFQRVKLAPGETKRVTIIIPEKDLSFYDINTKSWKLESGQFDILIGASSRDIKLKGEVNIPVSIFF